MNKMSNVNVKTRKGALGLVARDDDTNGTVPKEYSLNELRS